MRERGAAEAADGFGHLPGAAIALLDDIGHGADLGERRRARIRQAHMKPAPSMLSTCGWKRAVTAAIDRVVAVNGVDRDAGDRGKLLQHRIRRRRGIDELDVAGQVQLLDRQERIVVFGAELGDAVGDDVDHRTRRERAIEAAADAEVQRQVVGVAREHVRAPRGRRHHPDAGDEDVHVMRAIAVAGELRAALGDLVERGEKRRDLHRRRGDDQDPHRSTSDARRSTADACRSAFFVRSSFDI